MSPSVLFEQAHTDGGGELRDVPAYFGDLNLDQLVDAVTAEREEYDLKPFFYTPLEDVAVIAYRHEVMRDVQQDDVARCVESFAGRMRTMRERRALVEKLHYKRQREAWFVEAVIAYCEAVRGLADGLASAAPRSRGLQAIGDYLAGYVRSGSFDTLTTDTERLKRRLGEVTYSLTIKGNRINVDRYEPEPDYSAEVQETFARFEQGTVKDYRARFASSREMGHVEAGVLEFVTQLFPQVFEELADYCERHREFVDATLAAFDREIQFYMAFRDYIEPLRRAGLQFCYPHVSDSKDVVARDTFDLALAHKLVEDGETVVCNDWQLSKGERIFVVSGPNQGGKTTFARTFGQLHHLAGIGCLVPGHEARLLLCDQLLTHFEQQEDLSNRRGKLQDDLIRVHEILTQATPETIVVMNESFTSTTLQDARFLGTEVLERMVALDVLGVYVTFVDELASLGETIVSATSTVDPDDPAVRTYKIVRRAADGLAYAAAIAERYGLAYQTLKGRLAQ